MKCYLMGLNGAIVLMNKQYFNVVAGKSWPTDLRIYFIQLSSLINLQYSFKWSYVLDETLQ